MLVFTESSANETTAGKVVHPVHPGRDDRVATATRYRYTTRPHKIMMITTTKRRVSQKQFTYQAPEKNALNFEPKEKENN